MKKYYRINQTIYILLQLSWGLIQNVAAGILLMVLYVMGKIEGIRYYHGAILAYWQQYGSMGLGMFMFIGKGGLRENDLTAIEVHEYGHTIQSMILGPFYLPVIGLPSLLWANLDACNKYRRRNRIAYHSFCPERWANSLGKAILKQEVPTW